ncbi:mitochondrial potassium channel ATP-binding subunit isoform X3 [Dermochelys coriacea]|uniref:mitochondrial potassium channel ATP-binding subunit isoform X3 n=1 Tax=Dermochelys coriacea TaxID=27794 RepID=UPI001CA9DC8D|nr:mitochondrial potassium channel ATP-binding subunit isoform X3 [Dermochelys coriacea]
MLLVLLRAARGGCRARARYVASHARVSGPLRAAGRLAAPSPALPRCPFSLGRAAALLAGPALLGLGAGLARSGAHCQEAGSPGPAPASPKPEPDFNWAEFWKFLRPQLLALSAAVVFALGVALLNIRIPMLLGELVNVVARCTQQRVGNYLREMRRPAFRLLLLYSLQGLLTFSYIVLLARVGERVAGSMRKALFASLLRQDMAFFDANQTGQLVNRLTTDIQEFKSSFKLVISQGLRSVTQTVGCFAALYLLSPKLTGLLLVVMPSLVGAGALIGSVLRSLSRQAQEQPVLPRGGSVEPAEREVGQGHRCLPGAVQRGAELYCAGHRLCGGLPHGWGGALAWRPHVLHGGFADSAKVHGQHLRPVWTAGSPTPLLSPQVVRGLSAGARVFELMTLEPTVSLSGGDRIPSHSLLGHICFQDVCFSYPTRPSCPVLRNFSLTLPPRKTVAIVGESGGGKSTVAALLERFYEPTRGAITLDGRELCTLDPSWLRGQVIGFISQEPALFGTTILENIRFGKPSATDAEVYAAAQLANADSFIRSFPQGYGTIVGERGVMLSGGQKQRVAIARALLKNPSVLILDEATSALDTESEQVVQEALERAMAGRTVLVIAHRLSTIQGADLIVVLARGCVAEAGTHAELLRRSGLYAELIRRQAMEQP